MLQTKLISKKQRTMTTMYEIFGRIARGATVELQVCDRPTRKGQYVGVGAVGLRPGSVYFVGSNPKNESDGLIVEWVR